MRPTPIVRLPCRPGVAAALLMVLAVCAAQAAPAPPTVAGKAEPAAETKSAQTPRAGLIRGYYEHRDGGLFTVCGETSRRQVRMPKAPGFMADALASAGDTPRFLIASGNLVGQDEAEIFGLDLITTDAFDCDSRLQPLLYAGRGNELLSTLEITPAAITFMAAPGAKAEVFPYADFVSRGQARVAETSGVRSSLRIELRHQACTEKMTGSVFALSARIMTAGKTYSGCAWRGLAGG
jgi:uncharacterized membrane protein